MHQRIVHALATLLSILLPQALAADPQKSVEELKADFAKLKFGMFIHYNMETYHGVQWAEGLLEGCDMLEMDRQSRHRYGKQKKL